ncbi:MAG: hypothetical protein ACJA13_002219, partial [Paraglaciecola sp.]
MLTFQVLCCRFDLYLNPLGAFMPIRIPSDLPAQ